MQYDDISIGMEVAISRQQNRLGGPKYPGRSGVVVGENENGKFNHLKQLEGLWYVKLAATNRAKERVESFWSKELEKPVLVSEPAQREPAALAQP